MPRNAGLWNKVGKIITASDFNNCWRDNPPQVITESQAEKYYCEYCFGSTFDDSRGHCCACGHPRKEAEEPPIPCVGKLIKVV